MIFDKILKQNAYAYLDINHDDHLNHIINELSAKMDELNIDWIIRKVNDKPGFVSSNVTHRKHYKFKNQSMPHVRVGFNNHFNTRFPRRGTWFNVNI